MDLIPFGGASKINLQETPTDVIIVADIPGVNPKKIDVQISRDTVKISATTEEEKETKDKNYYRKELSVHSFQRVVPLPCPVKSDGVKAVAKNGTLTIALPKEKPQELKMKKIPVEE